MSKENHLFYKFMYQPSRDRKETRAFTPEAKTPNWQSEEEILYKTECITYWNNSTQKYIVKITVCIIFFILSDRTTLAFLKLLQSYFSSSARRMTN